MSVHSFQPPTRSCTLDIDGKIVGCQSQAGSDEEREGSSERSHLATKVQCGEHSSRNRLCPGAVVLTYRVGRSDYPVRYLQADLPGYFQTAHVS